ncbi:MAG: hypothetical protein R3B99_06055 [Polyangiales bacterium]
MGEADETMHQALDVIFGTRSKADALAALVQTIPSCYVPSIHGDEMPPVAKADDTPVDPAGALADRDAAHRAAGHVPDRAGAGLLTGAARIA